MLRLKTILQSALILIILYMTWSAADSYNHQVLSRWNPSQMGQDAASTWSARLELVQQDLPAEGVIGYLSEQDYPGAPFSPTDQDEEFVLTQYVMAPLILDRGNTRHTFVLGNFSNPYNYAFESELGLHLIYDYGYGIYLFRGTGE